MSEIILLSEVDQDGDTVLVEVFVDEPALREFLRDQIVVDGNTVRLPKQYTIERRKARTVTGKITPVTVALTTSKVEDKPFVIVKMPSQDSRNRDRNGNPTVYYDVSVDRNKIAYACTCPAFEHYSGPCKHMQDARWQHPNRVDSYQRR